MKIIDHMAADDYEQLVICQDRESGLRAIIAIHDTTLGPALGGTRMWPYQSEKEAFRDVLRLSRGMTYKNALAGLSLGGGKAVIIGDPARVKGEGLLRAYGRYLEALNGRYITAEDVGTCQRDMDLIREETRYVVGVSPAKGGSGDPSPFTALGVLFGLRAAVKKVFGSEDLSGRHVVVQGVGNVGYHLCRLLAGAGARLTVTDVNNKALQRTAAEFNTVIAPPEEIFGIECDIFAPCALGAVINDRTINRLRCRIVAGSANNVLAEARHGDLLHQNGIMYIPDYAINAGGVINVADELAGYDQQRVEKKVAGIYDTVEQILLIADQENIPPYQAADRLAEAHIKGSRLVAPGEGGSQVG